MASTIEDIRKRKKARCPGEKPSSPAEIPGKAEAAKNTAATTAIESLESIREPINPPHKPETAPTRRYSVALLNILHTTMAREAGRAGPPSTEWTEPGYLG